MDLLSAINIIENDDSIAIGTREIYSLHLKIFNGFCVENNLLPDINSLNKWLDEDIGNSTFNLRLAATKRAFRLMYEDSKKLSLIEKGLRTIKNRSKIAKQYEESFLTYQEYEYLLNEAPEPACYFIEGLYLTGLRISELLDIELKNCCVEDDEVKIQFNGIIISVTIEFYNRVKSFFKSKTYLYEHQSSKYNRKHIWFVITSISLEILGRKISPHTLRYTKIAHSMSFLQYDLKKIQNLIKNTDFEKTCFQYYL